MVAKSSVLRQRSLQALGPARDEGHARAQSRGASPEEKKEMASYTTLSWPTGWLSIAQDIARANWIGCVTTSWTSQAEVRQQPQNRVRGYARSVFGGGCPRPGLRSRQAVT